MKRYIAYGLPVSFLCIDEEFERNLKFDFEITEDMQDTGMYFIVFQNLFIESGFVFVNISI